MEGATFLPSTRRTLLPQKEFCLLERLVLLLGDSIPRFGISNVEAVEKT